MKDRIEAIETPDIPVWEKASLPEDADVIMIAKVFVEKYGCKMDAWYRLPLTRVANVAPYSPSNASINGNGFKQDIPFNKVVPAYTNISDPKDVRVASARSTATLAKYLILDNDLNNPGYYKVQSSGIYVFPKGHSYISGMTYYLGDDSYPTTSTNQENKQELFYVLDEKTIDIKVG